MQQQGARLPQVAARPRPRDPVTSASVNPPGKNAGREAALGRGGGEKSQTEQIKLQKSEKERKPNRRTRRKQEPGGRRRKHKADAAEQTAVLLPGMLCQRLRAGRADGGSRNPGLRLESCWAVASSHPGRESLLPSLNRSLAHACCAHG